MCDDPKAKAAMEARIEAEGFTVERTPALQRKAGTLKDKEQMKTALEIALAKFPPHGIEVVELDGKFGNSMSSHHPLTGEPVTEFYGVVASANHRACGRRAQVETYCYTLKDALDNAAAMAVNQNRAMLVVKYITPVE